jgi:hypothetical protein
MTNERNRLRNRRAHTLFDFEAMGMRFTASASRYDAWVSCLSIITKLGPRSARSCATARSFSASPCSTVPTLKRSAVRCAAIAKVIRLGRSVLRWTSSPMTGGER